MSKQKINDLLQKYIAGSIDDLEKQELFDLYEAITAQDAKYPDDQESARERILLRLNNEIQYKKRTYRFIKPIITAAAAAVIVVSAGIYIVNRPTANPNIATLHPTSKQVILPGTNVATLTLGNGKQILLNGANKGTLAVQGNTVITKNAAGQISYKVTGASQTNEEIAYNTVTTPLGGQYRITLPDGSDVWLNAGSSLKYPSRFVGNERHVELHGEAYFEIFKNKNAPFTVAAENVNIKVLGTHFNVMAYENEPAVNTTLLEGSVALSSKSAHAMLVPGQQAVADRTADNIILNKVNVEDAVAWKNGYFSFRKENIKTAMNKIARWYNVDVEYSGNVNNKVLGGTVSRAENINELLNYVELTGIAKFKIEGRRIKVICK
ncbi:FecR family protein [Mucilaginibacter pineti]|uniref:FecR family protein n=1 Tax=Mucilaginibacter pineti TaxID=1391627 RepID=A0A1G7E3Y0_9SPHI|nr:FecR family protein [Mucilaginibacter pineti]SDE58371.1 FecR family protein [Mucilaginibacter pineti]